MRTNVLILWYNRSMRRERITYPGAFHHAMNRGYDGNDIFFGNQNKNQFLDYLEDSTKKMKIRLFAYCCIASPGIGQPASKISIINF